jgi:hypothetical protein
LGEVPLKIESFLDVHNAYNINIMISIKKSCAICTLRLWRICCKSACALAASGFECGKRYFQQCSAKGHWKNKLSLVFWAVALHMTHVYSAIKEFSFATKL